MSLFPSNRTFPGNANRRLTLALLASTALVAVSVSPAAAVDADWKATPVSGDVKNASNWVQGLPGATDTGFFNVSSMTALTNNAIANFGGFNFEKAAPAYTLTNTGFLSFKTTGVTVNGAGFTLTTDGGSTVFSNSSSAGNATYVSANNSSFRFNSSSTAASATITNMSGVHTDISQSSTGGTANVTNQGNGSGTIFHDNTNAQGATISNQGTGSFTTFQDSAQAGSAIIHNSGGVVTFQNSSNANSAQIDNANGGQLIFKDTSTGGTAGLKNSDGSGLIDVSQSSNANFTAGSIAGAGFLNLGSVNLIVGGDNTRTTFSGTIRDIGFNLAVGGALTKTGTGTLTLTGNNSYSGGTFVKGGVLSVSSDANLGANPTTPGSLVGSLNIINATVQFTNSSDITLNRAVSLTGDAKIELQSRGFVTMTGVTGFGGLNLVANSLVTSGGVLQLVGTNTYFGATQVAIGQTLFVGSLVTGSTGSITNSASLTNNGYVQVTPGSSATFGGVTNTASARVVIGPGGFWHDDLNNSGTFTNNGTFVGNVNNAGIFVNNGSVSGAVNVSAGGTLTGTGSVGSLVFAASAAYMVTITGATATNTTVTGTATLGGTVLANATSRIGATTTYNILTAGTVSGSFASVTSTNNFARNARLSYSGNSVFLTVDPGLLTPNLPTSANVNQRNVAAGIDNGLTVALPAGFNTLFSLASNALPAALTQVSGEAATGSQQNTFSAMNQFMNVLTDPFIDGRGDPLSAGGNPSAYAEESLAYAAKRKPADALAAIYTKAPPLVSFEGRWSVWAAGYGGSQRTDGNAFVGSSDTRSSIYGTAVGADYRFSPNTIAGFALAGGGTNFNVINSGWGRSDLFQAGAFVRHNQGPAYITAALAYAWQDVTTNRVVTVAGLDQLRAQFNANAWSGRLEGGYRYVAPIFGGFGLTPYAALQATTFSLPGYAENAIVGSNQFALAYGAKSVTDTRTELGLRTDKSYAMTSGVLTLRGRTAWAHDFNPDRTIGATFQALPGSTFVVNGARQANDSLLSSAAIEFKWTNGWSAAGTIESEYSRVTTSYAGKGVVRYTW